MSVVEEFIESPSEVLLLNCTKDQLVEIAEHYDISLTTDDRRLKETLFKAVVVGLVGKAILPESEESPVSHPAAEVSVASSSLEYELKLQEYKLEEHKLQLEAAKLRVERENRIVKEKEIAKDIEMKKLELDFGLRKLEYEEKREEREFELCKLELELAATRLTTTPPVPSSYPLQGSQPSSPARASSAPLTLIAGAAISVASSGDNTAPPLNVPAGALSRNASLGDLRDVPLAPELGPLPLRVQPFDVTRNIRMVPPFNEREIEKYFTHFEKVAVTLRWPVEVWTLLLQIVLTGKA